MKKLFAILTATALVLSCSEKPQGENSAIMTPLVTGASVPSGQFFLMSTEEIVLPGKGYEWGDEVWLEANGDSFRCIVTELDEYSITIYIPRDLKSAVYRIVLRRDGVSQVLGYINLRNSISLDIPDKSGMTVKGAVFCGSTPLSGVTVSDGVEVVKTDQDGYYWMNSAKRHGYIFVSVPNGYKPAIGDNGLPEHWKALKTKDSTVEQVDFEMQESEIPSGGEFTLLAFADMHLAHRTTLQDEKQFTSGFIPDVREYVASNGKPSLAVNLGDMTFDCYWYSNKYNLQNYVNAIKDAALPFRIYHIPGNHDNDERATGATVSEVDLNAEAPYKRIVGPTWYSFNAGGIHFIMLDDTIYINTGATATSAGDNSYDSGLTTEQLNWLRKDLLTIPDKTRPVFVCIHCPAHSFNSSFGVTSAQAFNAFNACFTGFSNVHILSGHTHNNYNLQVNANMMEHNVAAVCATWWWTGYYKFPHICKDGTPGGYAVFDLGGAAIKSWDYHGINYDNGKKFRVYDVNKVKAWYSSDSKVAAMVAADASRASDYASFPDNSVLVNVWGYDPSWKVEVSEGGTPLAVEHVYCRDPYHTMCYDVVRYSSSSSVTTSFNSGNNYHMFRAVASKPNTVVTVKVTDRFGRVSTETVTLPRDFSSAVYSKDWK